MFGKSVVCLIFAGVAFHLASLSILCSCSDSAEQAVYSEQKRTGSQFWMSENAVNVSGEVVTAASLTALAGSLCEGKCACHWEPMPSRMTLIIYLFPAQSAYRNPSWRDRHSTSLPIWLSYCLQDRMDRMVPTLALAVLLQRIYLPPAAVGS